MSGTYDDDEGPNERPEESPEERREERRADDTALRSLIRGAYEDAASYADDILAPEREKAFDYFLGDVYRRDGEPEKAEDLQGRTSIVMREVADIIQAMLPGLIRIYTGGDEVVRFEPRGPEDTEVAEQQTDYVNYLLNADGNCWFVTLHDALHDALLKKSGILKWWWDERASIEEFSYSGLSVVQAQMLRDDPDIEVLDERAYPATPEPAFPPPAPAPVPDQITSLAGAGAPMPPGAPPGAPPGPLLPPGAPPIPQAMPMGPEMLVDMEVRRVTWKRCLRICAVPPEEFLIDRTARDVPSTPYAAHRTVKTVSDLVSQGYDRDEVMKHASADNVPFGTAVSTGRAENEAQQRNPGLAGGFASGTPDKSLWKVLHVEHFIRYDEDGDGIAELHRICTVGENCDYIHYDEVVPEVSFAVGSPVRVPHAVIGMSVADQVMDLQDLKTNVLRSTLDSLAQSIFPDMAVVETAVVMEDFLSTEVGRVLRMKAPGMAQPLAQPFIGAQAMGVLQYLDEVRAERTGLTRASVGLDDKVLQSTTKTAVDNTVEKAQERVEMIARTVAETLLTDFFKGVLRCIVRNQDKPRVVRLRNRWVEVDPRFWNADADVEVNVGLGRGTDQARMMYLGTIAEKQQQIITATGPGNPLCAPSQFRETLAEMTKLAGFKDASRFWKPITRADDQKIIQMAQQSQQQQQSQNPAVILAQVEQMKAKATADSKSEENRLKFIEAQATDDRERDKAVMDFVLKAAEIQARYGAQIDIANLKAMVDRERGAFQDANDVQMKRDQMMQQAMQQQAQQGQQHALAQQQLGQDGQLAREKIQSAENIAQFRARQPPPGGAA